MKVILVIATSLDGKITMGDNPDVHAFTSPEDTDFFRTMLSNSRHIVMGRRTYDTMKAGMKHKQERIRVVLTHDPDKYKNEEIKGQLEFTDEQPKDLAERFEKSGYKELLLVSGADVTTEFFKENLVDEVYLTLEPWVLGAGKPVVLQSEINTKLELLNVKKLNMKGTLLLHYKVLK
jgi:dihydrofolate reductase